MLGTIGRTLALATVLAALAAGQASAAITETAITTPGPGPLFFNPDLDGEEVYVEVSGTTDSTNPNADLIDINCALGSDEFGPLVESVPLASDGTFETQIDITQLGYYICRLIAVPAGEGPPFPLDDRQGPVLSVGGFSRDDIGGGPNDGKLFDFSQFSSALQGYWSVHSAGECFVVDSYPTDPVTFGYDDDALFGCSRLRQDQPVPAGKELQIDGRTALLPSGQLNVTAAPSIGQPAEIPGFGAIASFSGEIETEAGNMLVTSVEPATFCEPGPEACEQFVDAGIRLEARTTGGTQGRTLTIEHDWVNTTGEPKQLHAPYDIRSSTGGAWRFPGDADYAARAGGSTVTPPAGDAPATFYVRDEAGQSCSAAADCGSVTWAAPPGEIFFTSPQSVLLSYDRTIPAGCRARIAFTYSHGRVRSSVDTYVAAAETALATQPSITCPPPAPPVTDPPVTTEKKKKKKCKKKAKGKKRKGKGCKKRKKKKRR